MSTEQPATQLRRPLRLWPGVVLATLVVILRIAVPMIAQNAVLFGIPLSLIGVLAGVAGGIAIVIWWVFFSRAAWQERIAAVALMAVAVVAIRPLLHESIAGAGMGMLFYVNAIPAMTVVFALWAVATRHVSGTLRWASMAAAVLLACGSWTLVRTGGITGEGDSDLHWRWTMSPEERLLAEERHSAPPGRAAAGREAQPMPPDLAGGTSSAPTAVPPEATAPANNATATTAKPESSATGGTPALKPGSGSTPAEPAATIDRRLARAEWPGFRGPDRDGVVQGLRIATDWSTSPPVELWRRPIGPGWSSFAVQGDRVYTQEQRGDAEIVSCYRLSNGEPLWRHRDAVRFYESNGGPGPRGTPTLGHGRVYTMGATGIVNALDAVTGALVWSRNAATDADRAIPDWGIASSPLVVGDLVIVAAAGRLVAYGAGSGTLRWLGEPGGGGYSSPHLATIAGVPQILLIRGSRTISVAPEDGTPLWDHAWERSVAIVQPALVDGSDVLISAAEATGMGGMGMRRISVTPGPSGWMVRERWTSRGLKPYFNDSIVHEGHVYGFDGAILAAIDVADGARKWKGGRYGHGQVLLLADQDVLLVLSEDGELALVSATPDQFRELARMPAIEGKTWNHPVIVGDVLLVRNGEEMAAFRLPQAGR